MTAPLLALSERGLYCAAGDFFIDPHRPVPRAILTHAHSDHARRGSGAYLAAAPSLGVLRDRLGKSARLEGMAYGERRTIGGGGGVRVSFHPAGHVLGSAQVRVESAAGEVWVVSGDYKRQADPTCAPFEPVRCDVFVTEATFALPLFRWPSSEHVAREIVAWRRESEAAGRAAILGVYALGKAQRVLAEVGRLEPERTTWLHPAVDAMTARYREHGIALPPTASVEEAVGWHSFAGALVLAPTAALESPFLRRFGAASLGFASGWMLLPSRRRRSSFDRGFALSDHADWPDLLATIEATGAARVLATHGFAAPLARYLRERGLDAAVLGEEGER